MLLGVLDHVRVLVGGDLFQEPLGQIDELLLGLERHAHLPEREAGDVAVEGVVGVMGHVGREARLPKRPQDGLHPLHPLGAGPGLPHHQAARPAVAQEHLVGRDRGPADRLLPVGVARRHLDLAGDRVDDAVEEVVLVRHVVVERHRLDSELLAELAHAE